MKKIIFSITDLFPFFGQTNKKNVQQKDKRKSVAFLLCIVVGILLAVFSGSKIITPLLESFPLEIYSLFTGLILACLPLLLKHIQKNIKSLLIIIITTFAFALFLQMTRGFSQSTQPSLAWMFLSVFLACFSALLPGISGSSVLLMMGVYHFLLQAISEGMWSVLFLCILSGTPALFLALFSMRFLLQNKKSLTFCILFGFILGSLPVIFPVEHWQSSSMLLDKAKALVFLTLGFGFLFLIERKKLSN